MSAAAGAGVLGAIIAGGASTRFGRPKALARVGGVRVIDRAAAALRTALEHDDIIAIINDPDIARAVDLPHRADARAGAGALGGLHAALLEAQQRASRGILAVGCDMPFLSVPLLRLLLTLTDYDATLPESESRRGVEPLCAWYHTSCTSAIEAALERGDARMIGFHRDVDLHRVPLATVQSYGDPTRMFMNLNTPTDLQQAEEYARDENG